MKKTQIPPQNLRFIVIGIAGFVIGSILITSFIQTPSSFLRSKLTTTDSNPTSIQLLSILHYATTKVIPQQTIDEIRVSFDVLKSLSPCNFLVFGLGRDSLMWASFNPHGTTLFLEEDPKWVKNVLKDAPFLNVQTVNYRTHLSESNDLVKSYKSEPSCLPENAYLKGNIKCKLALIGLVDEVYDKEWDLIMIDAPRGYYPEAPGRMAAIFSAAVMARNRKGSGVTHVFLHDVERKVEKMFGLEFLCEKYLVKQVGKLWHFEIPSMVNRNSSVISGGNSFC